jgi:hypothetical protein
VLDEFWNFDWIHIISYFFKFSVIIIARKLLFRVNLSLKRERLREGLHERVLLFFSATTIQVAQIL